MNATAPLRTPACLALLIFTLALAGRTDHAGASGDPAGPSEFHGGGSAARAFARESQQTIRLGAGRPEACIQLESVNGSFELDQVFLRTMKLLYRNPVPGGVQKIMVVEAMMGRDTDHNGMAEICACFAKEDLRRMFRDSRSSTEIEVRLHGALKISSPDNWFEAPLTLRIVSDDQIRVRPRNE